MTLQFPPDFRFGTSTAATQIETASAHNWRGLRSRDGYVFDRTTDHELRRAEDAEHAARLGNYYRGGVDWARLQPEPLGAFVPEVVAEYREFFEALRERGCDLLFVVHHFTNPLWLEERGGWTTTFAITAYLDFCRRCVEAFGDLVWNWNTFNEPNVYALNGYLTGEFPPHRRSRIDLGTRVLRHMGKAHERAYALIKGYYPDTPVGISLNTCWFEGLSLRGRVAAKFTDWWFHEVAARQFTTCDYWGLSYYAYIPFDPGPITYVDTPEEVERRGLPHSRLWCHRPEGLARNLRRFYAKYGKPLLVTESGICTDDPEVRIAAVTNYLKGCHALIEEGIPLLGYTHWSTWDNFEWALGPTYRFGLLRLNLETMERENTPAADWYAEVVRTKGVEVG